MARKQAVQPQPPPPPAPPRRAFSPLLALALAVGIVTIAVIGYSRSGSDVQAQPDAAPPVAQAAGQPPVAESAAPPANAKFGPHTQATFPPLPFGPSPPARPADVVRAVYRFAGEHPEVLGYVPCYCGCERSGHRGNDDCFVTTRAANGDVAAWESHGMT